MPLEAVNPDRLDVLRRLGTPDDLLLTRVVRAFVDVGPARVSAIRASAQGGDSAALADAAHLLLGAAATVGATAVVDLCCQLDAMGRRADLTGAAELVDRLAAEMSRAEVELNRAVAAAR
ncbi:MAG: Hpt domain-containing protein [Mycobacteriales bacterium]